MNHNTFWYLVLAIGLAITGYAIFKITQKPKLQNIPLDIYNTKEPLTNKEKGNLFETYVIERLAVIPGITLRGKNADYHSDIISAEENKEPDLKFTFKPSKKDPINFAVECKYRSAFDKKEIICWAKEYQIKNYNKYQTDTNEKVLIALGVGGTPDLPKFLYFIPLKRIPKNFVTKEYAEEFSIKDFIPLDKLLNN